MKLQSDKMVPEQITVKVETETIPHKFVQQSSEVETLKDTIQFDEQNRQEEIAAPKANQGADRNNTPGGIPSPMVTHSSHRPVIHNHTFSMHLEKVSDDIIANNIEGNTIVVLSPVKNKTLDISSIVASEGSQTDPVLQKDLDFMRNWLSKAETTEVPFIEVVSKSRKNKNMQKVPYKTRSQGRLPPFK